MQRKLGYLFQKMDIGFCDKLESLLLRRETDNDKINTPFIAVIGAPRSGTTLTFQIVSQMIDGMAINNLHYLFYRTPLVGYRLSKLFTKPYISNYRSDFGFISGLNGLAQAYQFWLYWCDQNLIESPPKPDEARLQRFKKVMNAIYRIDGRPFLAGFQAHPFYIDQLASLFSRCLFVLVKRDTLSSAYSMLMGMKQKDGTFIEISSATPKEHLSGTGQTPYEKVARQAFFINRRIAEMQMRHSNIIFESDYYENCRSTYTFTERLAEFLKERDFPFDYRTDVKIPETFNTRHITRDHDDDARRIAAALDTLTEKNGSTD